MDNNTPGNGRKEKLINLCGLWKATAKNGNVYLRGRIGGATVLILVNKFKTAENQPDFTLCLGSAQPRDDNADENDFVEILGALGARNLPRQKEPVQKPAPTALFNERAAQNLRSSATMMRMLQKRAEAVEPIEKRRAEPAPRKPAPDDFDLLDTSSSNNDEDVMRFIAAADQDDFGNVPPPRRRRGK